MNSNDIENSAFSRILREINEAKEKLNRIELEENPNSPKGLTFWFRGVSDSSYKLTPSLYRMDFESTPNRDLSASLPPHRIPTDKEFILLRAFFAREHFESMRGEDVDPKEIAATYAKMQHYGAPTRLIDWTESFGTALFFATNDNPETDGRLYITSPERMESEFAPQVQAYGFKDFIATLRTELYENSRAKERREEEREGDIPFPGEKGYFDVVRHPRFTNPRILAQRGHFTFTIALPETRPQSKSVKFIDISKKEKKEIKDLLAQMNVDEYTVYPDIIGLASYVKSAANLNPRKEFDAIRYFSEPETDLAAAFLLKRAGKRKLNDIDTDLFKDTHRSILSEAIYNRDFVEQVIKNNIEDETLRNKVVIAFNNLGKTYLGNIIFPFHLKKRAESFVCEILGQHRSEDASAGPLEYHHSSGLGSFDRFTTSLDPVAKQNGNNAPFKQIISINNPADLIEKSVSSDFTTTRFHKHHNVCAPEPRDGVPHDEYLQPLFSSLDGVRKIAILVSRLLQLSPDDDNLSIKYHSQHTDRPGMTYRACNQSSDCIIFLTANSKIPRPFSTFGLYLEKASDITKQLTAAPSRVEERRQFPAEDLLNRVHHDQSNFLREIGGLLAAKLRHKFPDDTAIGLLNREDVVGEIVKKCELTDDEAEAQIDKIEEIVKKVLDHAKASFDNV